MEGGEGRGTGKKGIAEMEGKGDTISTSDKYSEGEQEIAAREFS